MQFNTRKTTNPIQKWEEDLNKHFSKQDMHMANKVSMLLIMREMQIKTITRSLHTGQNGRHQEISNNKFQRGYEEKGALFHYWWECKLTWPLWKPVWRFL